MIIITSQRKAFTMIELIFVIVIIGILAAVAIPKLAATRDDAKISNIISNTRTILSDFTAFYTATGMKVWTANDTYVTNVTSVPVYTDATCTTAVTTTDKISGDTFYLCDETGTGASDCISFVTDANGTQVSVISASTGDSPICDGVVGDPAIKGMTGGPGQTKIYKLGGQSITR